MKRLRTGVAWLLVLLCLSSAIFAALADDETAAPDTTAAQATEATEDTPYIGIAQVTTEKGTLNLRRSPSSKATVLIRIPNQSLVKVLTKDENDEYWQIEFDGTQGYAVSTFLTMTDYDEELLSYDVLARNSYGDAVLAMKQRLLELGYYRDTANLSNIYNSTCVERVKMFERQNGFEEDGIASAQMQAVLFSDQAVENAEELPKPVSSSSFIIASSSSSTSSDGGDDDFVQWMADHPGVCPCCQGKGCACCNWTGKIQ